MLLRRPKKELKQRSGAIRLDFRRRYNLAALRQELFDEQSGLCAIGKESLQSADSIVAQVDHAIPVVLYATWDYPIEEACAHANAKKNLVLVCRKHHAAKRTLDLLELLEGIEQGEISLEKPTPFSEKYIERIRQGARRAGLKRFRLHGSPATQEGRAKGGRIVGRNNVKSGLLARIQPLGGRRKFELYGGPTPEMRAKAGRTNVKSGHIQNLGRIYGPIAGRKAAESGLLASIASQGARKRNELYGNPASTESCAKGGRAAAHLLWHVRRNKPNPLCEFCGKTA